MKKTFLIAAFALVGLAANAQSGAQTTENNWFIQTQVGASYATGNNGIGDLISPAAQIAFGKYFNSAVGARLAISGWRGRGGDGSNHPGYGFYYGAATVDGLFNLSTLFAGSNPRRLFHASLIAGVGYNQTFDEGASSFMARVGLQGKIRLNDAFDLNLEALANGVSDRWNRRDDHSFDSYFNVLVGITYKLGTGFNLKCPDCKPVVYKNNCYDEAYVKSLNDKINELQSEIDNHECPQPEPCPEQVVAARPTIRKQVHFLIAKTNVPTDEESKVAEVAEYLKKYPEAKASVIGYADRGTGTSQINERLARQRAQTVAGLLTGKYGISADRLTVDSKGSDEQPFADNDSNRVVIMVAE